jgi:hypothetical protein
VTSDDDETIVQQNVPGGKRRDKHCCSLDLRSKPRGKVLSYRRRLWRRLMGIFLPSVRGGACSVIGEVPEVPGVDAL